MSVKFGIWLRLLPGGLAVVIGLAACSAPAPDGSTLLSGGKGTEEACRVTEPEWLTYPEDPAVSGTPAPGYYFVNPDRSIWASAGWIEYEEYRQAGGEGVKVGWFRPAGKALEITGRRLDGEAPPLHSDVPCCYPTRFQATGLLFPTEGCWEVAASAADRELTFVVRIDPAEGDSDH